MNLKDSVILAMRQARKDGSELVVGQERGKWIIRDMNDQASDSLEHGLVITPDGFKYPSEEAIFYRLQKLGE